MICVLPGTAGIDGDAAWLELLCKHPAVRGLAQLAHAIHAPGPALLPIAAQANKADSQPAISQATHGKRKTGTPATWLCAW